MANVILENFEDIEYTLIDTGATYQRFVAAWLYDKDTDSWAQGHYFETVSGAMEYINGKLKELDDLCKENHADENPREMFWEPYFDDTDMNVGYTCDIVGVCSGHGCPMYYSCQGK